MDLYATNFGLSGQIEGYDSFIFCGRKCKKRKEERHKAKIERRTLKNDQRRAETERLRSETGLMEKEFEPNEPVNIPIQKNPIRKSAPKPYYPPPRGVMPVLPIKNGGEKPRLKNNYLIPIVIIGLLGLGGVMLVRNKAS